MPNELDEICRQIEELYPLWRLDAYDRRIKGNQTAGVRSRKLARGLRELFKRWGKVSAVKPVK